MKDLKRILSNQKAELDVVDLEVLCSRKEEQEIQLNSTLRTSCGLAPAKISRGDNITILTKFND